MRDRPPRSVCPYCGRLAATVLGSCSECGASRGDRPSYIEERVRGRQSRQRGSASGEWWDLFGSELALVASVIAALWLVGYLLYWLVD